MEMKIAVQSGTLIRALRVQLKRKFSARRGGDYHEVSQAIQKKSRPLPSNCVVLALEISPHVAHRVKFGTRRHHRMTKHKLAVNAQGR
jgi:hypothetical protein